MNQNEPILMIRLAVFYIHVAAEQICDLPRNEAGIIWDSICFAFLLLQRRVFMSYYFLHVVADIRASQILASRYRRRDERRNKERNQAGFVYSTTSGSASCILLLLRDILRLMNFWIHQWISVHSSVTHFRPRGRVFQRGGAFPGHYREGGESQTGGRAKVCGAAEETVRIQNSIYFLFYNALSWSCLSLKFKTLFIITQ